MAPIVTDSQAKLATRLAFIAAGFGVACWAPLVPYAKARCQVDHGTMGLILLLLAVGSILAMPLAANLSARFGSKPIVLSGGLEPVINFVPLHAMGWGYVWYAMTMESWGIVVGVAIRVM